MTYPVASRRHTVARFVVGYTVVAATLPYLALKLLWLTGEPVGLNDPELLHGRAIYALNLLTGGMDAVAVLIALAFTHRWGMRLPAWLVLPPMWVGTGLLGPIAVIGPFAALYLALTGGPVGDGPIQRWVYGVVYTGFVVEGVALMAAFVLYARTRWPAPFRTRVGDVRPGATHRLQVVIGRGAAALAALMGAFHLTWALGVGASADELADRTAVAQVSNGLHAVLAFAAAVGILMLVRPDGRARTWLPVTLTWLGSAAMFAWGGWTLLVVLSGSQLGRGVGASAAVSLVALGRMLAGALIGTVAAFALSERDAGGAAVPTRPATEPAALTDREVART